MAGAVLLPLVAVFHQLRLGQRHARYVGPPTRQTPEVLPAIIGLVILIGGAILCAIAGARVAFTTATAALAQLGITAPLMLALYWVALDPVLGWIAAAVGVAAGCLAAVSRWREHLAVGLGVVSAIVLFIAAAAH